MTVAKDIFHFINFVTFVCNKPPQMILTGVVGDNRVDNDHELVNVKAKIKFDIPTSTGVILASNAVIVTIW